jgi:hypothetical protein
MMKYSVCNELFGDYPIEKAAEILSRTGYQGIEFAPYTMFGNFTDCEINSGIRKIKSALSGNGLEFVGFHWLLSFFGLFCFLFHSKNTCLNPSCCVKFRCCFSKNPYYCKNNTN